MRIRSTQAALLALLATSICGELWGQESTLSAGGGASWKGIEIRFVTRVEPPGDKGGRLPGAVMAEAGRVHHLINDDAHKRYFAYDIVLEPSPDGKSAQLRIEPLRSTHEISGGPGYTLLELPKYPVIPNVKVGDTVALDLLVNAATGQKIVDYLTLMRRADLGISEGARDFTLADVELTLNRPRVFLNGVPADVPSPNYGISGTVVWFYLTGHGRFKLSLFPNERLGFQKNGVVSANALAFRDGATEYRIECTGAIVPGEGTYNLYVVHEPEWAGLGEPFTIGSGNIN